MTTQAKSEKNNRKLSIDPTKAQVSMKLGVMAQKIISKITKFLKNLFLQGYVRL